VGVPHIEAGGVPSWAEALAHIGVAVIETDVRGRVASWNDAAEALFGWSAREAIGRPVLELLTRPEQADGAVGLHQMAMAGRTWSGQVLAQRRDQSLVHIRSVISARRGPDNEIIGSVGMSVEHSEVDTTELARASEVLRDLVVQLSSAPQLQPSTTPSVEGLDLLSPRERDVLALLRQGLRVPTVAERLSVSPHTVRNHLRSIFRKLGVSSQRELLDRFVPEPDTPPA